MSEYIIKAADWAIDYKGESLFKGCEEIVRCGDCKYLCDDGSTWGCGWHCSCLSTNDGTPPDGFCAWGEPRGDA